MGTGSAIKKWQKHCQTKTKRSRKVPKIIPKCHKKYQREPKDSPAEVKAPKKTARERQRDPGGSQRTPKDRQRPCKKLPKLKFAWHNYLEHRVPTLRRFQGPQLAGFQMPALLTHGRQRLEPKRLRNRNYLVLNRLKQ